MESRDGSPAATYRFGPPNILAVTGSLALAILWVTALMLSRGGFAGAAAVQIVCAVATVVFAFAYIRSRSQRASECIAIDDSGVSSSTAAGYRTLRWEQIGDLSTRRGALELADSNRLVVVTMPRHIENFDGAVKSVLVHLERAYDRRAIARSRVPTNELTLALSIRTQILENAGVVVAMAVGAWTYMSALWGGITALPIALWDLGRTPYSVTVGRFVRIRTLAWTHEIPVEDIRSVALDIDAKHRLRMVIEDSNRQQLVVPLPKLVGRQLDLYDRVRRLTEARTCDPGTNGTTTRLAPQRAALFAGGCLIVSALIVGGAVLSGEMLRFAAQRGYDAMARAALELGSPVDARGVQRITPLFLAAKFGRLSIVNLLLASGADPAKPSRDVGFTPLHVSAEYGHVDIVRVLLKAGVSPDVRNDWKQTPLWQISWQTRAGMEQIAGVLIDAGATIDAADKDGWTPLHMAVRSDRHAFVAYLIRRGADVRARTNKGNTPMRWAIANNRPESLRAMIRAGADVNAQDGEGRTPLAYAVARRQPQPFVDILLAAGARTDIPGNDEYNPLQIAVWNGDWTLVDLLLRHGGDPNITVKPVDLPLFLAIQRGHTDIARTLLNAGAKWDREVEGFTALQRAALSGNADIVKALIASGANPSAASSAHPPPLILAAERGAMPVVSLLVEWGADVNQRWGAWSALRIARQRKHTPVVDYLLAHGGDR